jgi:hypothetical protein
MRRQHWFERDAVTRVPRLQSRVIPDKHERDAQDFGSGSMTGDGDAWTPPTTGYRCDRQGRKRAA